MHVYLHTSRLNPYFIFWRQEANSWSDGNPAVPAERNRNQQSQSCSLCHSATHWTGKGWHYILLAFLFFAFLLAFLVGALSRHAFVQLLGEELQITQHVIEDLLQGQREGQRERESGVLRETLLRGVRGLDSQSSSHQTPIRTITAWAETVD